MTVAVALIGLGEVGRVLAEDLAGRATVTAWDVALSDAASPAARNAAALGLTPAGSATAAVAEAALVISAVTAANDEVAARSVAAALPTAAFYLDLNSASPQSKQATAAIIDGAGGRYVEAAVMSPIEPERLGSPMLLGGPHAADFLPWGAELGFTGLRLYADTVGPAAATKLARSVVVKGLEALLLESMITARAWGVEDDVLASLSNMVPGPDWPELALYMMSRAVQHGGRRAEEMDEAAATVGATGLAPLLATACARRQEWAAQFGPAADSASVAELVDRINTMRAPSP